MSATNSDTLHAMTQNLPCAFRMCSPIRMCSLIRMYSAMTALQGAEGGKGLVRVYRASEDGGAGEVLALPPKIFESNEQQARACSWRQ